MPWRDRRPAGRRATRASRRRALSGLRPCLAGPGAVQLGVRRRPARGGRSPTTGSSPSSLALVPARVLHRRVSCSAATPGSLHTVQTYLSAEPAVPHTPTRVAATAARRVGDRLSVCHRGRLDRELRSSQRAIWRVDQQPGNVVVRRADRPGDAGRAGDPGGAVTVDLRPGSRAWCAGCWSGGAGSGEPGSGTPSAAPSRSPARCSSYLVNSGRRRPAGRRTPAAHVAAPAAALGVAGRAGADPAQHLGRCTSPAPSTTRPTRWSAGTVGLLLFMYLFNQLLLFGAALRPRPAPVAGSSTWPAGPARTSWPTRRNRRPRRGAGRPARRYLRRHRRDGDPGAVA